MRIILFIIYVIVILSFTLPYETLFKKISIIVQKDDHENIDVDDTDCMGIEYGVYG